MDPEEYLTSKKLKGYLDNHAARIPRYNRLMNMYKRKHDISYEDEINVGKSDNRLVVNYAKYIVDTLNGYFLGNSIKTIHEDKKVDEKLKVIAKRNRLNDKNAELSKMCSIYGHAYEFLYQDVDATTRVTYLQPQSAFVIYENTISQEPLYGVRVLYDSDGNTFGTIYSKEEQRKFYTTDSGGIIIEDDAEQHFFGDVPIIEYVENEERKSAFEDVETLINTYEKALSNEVLEIEYFADANLSVFGLDLDEVSIKNKRMISLANKDSESKVVHFFDKPYEVEAREYLLDRLEKLIFQISMVPSTSDQNFGNSSVPKSTLQTLENVARLKERKFHNGMVKRFKMMFAIPTNFGVDREEYLNIDYVFTRNKIL